MSLLVCRLANCRSIDNLPGHQNTVDRIGNVQVPHDARNVDRAGRDGVCTGAGVERAAAYLQDISVGLLQWARMGVEVRAEIERRQQLGCGQLTNRRGFDHALPGQE